MNPMHLIRGEKTACGLDNWKHSPIRATTNPKSVTCQTCLAWVLQHRRKKEDHDD